MITEYAVSFGAAEEQFRVWDEGLLVPYFCLTHLYKVNFLFFSNFNFLFMQLKTQRYAIAQ